MDGMVLGLFLLAAFLGGLTTGLAGFAMGLVVSGVWLHILTPFETAILVTFFGVVTQAYAVWWLRRVFSWRKVAPFVIGSAIGVPLGTLLLAYADPAHVRTGVGVLLVIYSGYNLVRPALHVKRSNPAIDVGIGIANGWLGGLTGLGGIIIAVWCQLRGWPKDEQRAVFQPVLLMAQIMGAVSLSLAGGVTPVTTKLFLLGLPTMLAGMWCGFKLYGKLDDAAFRKIILVLLLIAGLSLIVPLVTGSR